MPGTITPIGIGRLPSYIRSSSSGQMIEAMASPGPTNTPVIFEPPPPLTGGQGEVWIFATGGTHWGGCQVLISTDGSTYSAAPVGSIASGGRQGVLLSTFASHTDPDTVNTLSVDLTMSLGKLLSGTVADADNFITLCYCDGELVSYETATLTAANKYDLTYIRRGVMGTTIKSHPPGAQFVRVDINDNDSVFRIPYPPNLIGQTLFIKLPGFNKFGQLLEDVSTVTAYSHVITGAGNSATLNPTVASIAAGNNLDLGDITTSIIGSADLDYISVPVGTTINLGMVP